LNWWRCSDGEAGVELKIPDFALVVLLGASTKPRAAFVFGGRMTALRYPERELVAVPAARAYFAAGRSAEPSRGGG
jgi:hypothetical protein